jgi:RecB family endonuclease NucS
MKLNEKDMEDLIIKNPQKYLNEPDLKLVSRQYSIGTYRFDLLFQDRHNGKVIVEIQRGTLDRNHTYKILDYFDEYKNRNPSTFIDLIIVANKITQEEEIVLVHMEFRTLRYQNLYFGRSKFGKQRRKPKTR